MIMKGTVTFCFLKRVPEPQCARCITWILYSKPLRIQSKYSVAVVRRCAINTEEM